MTPTHRNGVTKLLVLLGGLLALGVLGCRCSIPKIGSFEFRLLPTDAAVRIGNCPTNAPGQ
jgi:hypothetical protein